MSPAFSSKPYTNTTPEVPLNTTLVEPLTSPKKDSASEKQAATSNNHSPTLALAGNPNVGKSVIFGALTGRYVNVSNFPGTTVDLTTGCFQQHPDATLRNGNEINVVDTPGVYGLSGGNDEERVAEEAIMKADWVINVTSALTLERDLFFTQQLIDYGKPLILVVNQLDEAAARNRKINLNKLAELMGIPVFGTVATTGEGMDAVKAHYTDAKQGFTLPDSPGPDILRAAEKDLKTRLTTYGLRRQRVNAILKQVIEETQNNTQEAKLSKQLGLLLLNPVIGLLSLLVVLLLLYQVVGVWVAGDLVNFIEGTVMLTWVVPTIQSAVKSFMPDTFWGYQLLAGEFGVLTMSIQYIFGVLFPLVLGFYIYLSILEDCGYLPRIAVLSDGLLKRIGLNGRAIIPIILGFGCVTMATVSTRMLNSQRERTIASTLLAITIPCSAQLGVIMGLIAIAGGLQAWMIYIGILFSILVILGTVLNKLIPGRSTNFVMDLPPMRLPQWKNIATKTWIRTKGFLYEAAPLFLLGSLIVAVLQVSGLLLVVQDWLKPVTQSLLHLPAETAQAFVMGTVRRDFGVAGLYFIADQMTSIQMLTCLVVITLFVPCIASAAVIWKERGLLESTLVLFGSWILAFGVGAITCRILEVIYILI